MYRHPNEYLQHIADECSYLLSLKNKVDKEQFLEDETLKRAVVRSLEIIGEASKKIPKEFKERWTTLEWKSMSGMRDRLIHDYMGVNYLIVWDVLETKIPLLDQALRQISEDEGESS